MAIEDILPDAVYPAWQNEYETALLELDPEKLPQRVEAAEAAIFERLQAISQSTDHHTERQVIEDALTGLRVLKRDELGFPDWLLKTRRLTTAARC
jgi:hypothetical protein